MPYCTIIRKHIIFRIFQKLKQEQIFLFQFFLARFGWQLRYAYACFAECDSASMERRYHIRWTGRTHSCIFRQRLFNGIQGNLHDTISFLNGR